MEHVPTLRLSQYRTGSDVDKKAFVEAVGNALRDVGFFVLQEHGVSEDAVKNAYKSAEAYFLLDESHKLHTHDAKLQGRRGYTPFGVERAKGSTKKDLKEFFHIGPELPEGSPHVKEYGENIWPDTPDTFRPHMQSLWKELGGCADTLLEACALYLGEDARALSSLVQDGNTVLRCIHYPPVNPSTNKGALRAAAHEDINFITLLCEATDGGLEILDRSGNWHAVRTQPGEIVVDSGDMLQHFTNGVFRSTTHRVTNPEDSSRRRFSMPYFVHPRGDVDLTPLKSCVDRTGEAKYGASTAQELLDQRLRENGVSM